MTGTLARVYGESKVRIPSSKFLFICLFVFLFCLFSFSTLFMTVPMIALNTYLMVRGLVGMLLGRVVN